MSLALPTELSGLIGFQPLIFVFVLECFPFFREVISSFACLQVQRFVKVFLLIVNFVRFSPFESYIPPFHNGIGMERPMFDL